jgi:soluble lytic murein transglycosylase-like protein
MNETFYGLLASSALGIRKPMAKQLHDYRDSEWQSVAGRPNVRAAIALNEIGERNLADELIRHQARMGNAADHNALLHLASDLNLAGTQFWLAHNAPAGARVNIAARYPNPNWQPVRGWRVDKALAYAHALQESSFRTQVVSPAGASGVMQVRPGTAGDMARSRGDSFHPSQLSDPTFNLEYGQSYLEYLRDYGATGGLLLKVIAAYICGPAPVGEWNLRAIDGGDPCSTSIDPILGDPRLRSDRLRNYWVYDRRRGVNPPAAEALAQGLGRNSRGARGPAAVRLEPRPPVSAGVAGTN